MKAWVNGQLVDGDDPESGVGLGDHGVLVGDGAFEMMKVIDGTAFAPGRHFARLTRTLSGLGITCPDLDELRDAVDSVIAANGPEVGRVRLTITSGGGPLGSARGDGTPTVTVLSDTMMTWADTAPVVVVPWVRNERGATAGLKTTSYAENVIALAFADERGGSEAVFANTLGQLCEGTGSNVFVGIGGRLLTPPLSSGCLAGVTRELLLELGHGEESDLPLDVLAAADEAFLSSSTRDVQPIATVDDHPLPAAPGPLTAAAAAAFAALVAVDMDP